MSNTIVTPTDIFKYLVQKHRELFPVHVFPSGETRSEIIAYGTYGSLELTRDTLEQYHLIFAAGNINGKLYGRNDPDVPLCLEYNLRKSSLSTLKNLESLAEKGNPVAKKILVSHTFQKEHFPNDPFIITDALPEQIEAIGEFVMMHYR